ncbi:MAG: hypothetical protein M3458_16805 [Acidobacteriota bacterium]|nr:hypothetical protein [Acidobacteriota bacterium]
MPATNATVKKPRASTKRTTSKAATKTEAKREEERRHYQHRLQENEARLVTGLTARDEQMTPQQMETLRRVVAEQQVKLDELMADTNAEM